MPGDEELTVDRLVELEAAAERGDWAALQQLPMELWPAPTLAMEVTLRNLSPYQKQMIVDQLNAERVACGLPGRYILTDEPGNAGC